MALVNDAPAAPPRQSLGQYIRARRRAARLTQAQVAGRIGVSPQAVSLWENDETTPSNRALHFLAQEIPGMDPAYLLSLIPTGPR